MAKFGSTLPPLPATLSGKGFEVRSPCGRAWFVPVEMVERDYAEFLVHADGLSGEAALKQACDDDDFAQTWFCEQYIWEEAERDGVKLGEWPKSDRRTRAAARWGANPSDDYTCHPLVPKDGVSRSNI